MPSQQSRPLQRVAFTGWNRLYAGAIAITLILLSACNRQAADGGPDRDAIAEADRDAAAPRELFVFAGAASQPATSEVARVFERETGIRVECTFGGSGTVLNQIRMEHFGDVYLPGSNDYMDIAEKENLTLPKTRKIICYLIPAICVAAGNPTGIKSLLDLTKKGTKVTIGDPNSVCLGVIAQRAMEKAGIYRKVQANIVTYASDCQQVVNLIRLREVDAAVGYDVFQRQSPDEIDLVAIKDAETLNIPAAVVRFSKHPEYARKFVAFIAGPRGKDIFARHGYTIHPD